MLDTTAVLTPPPTGGKPGLSLLACAEELDADLLVFHPKQPSTTVNTGVRSGKESLSGV
jgi:hypothetical protein